jgi:hypothetical protein
MTAANGHPAHVESDGREVGRPEASNLQAHTPGPWEYEDGDVEVTDESGAIVAEAPPHSTGAEWAPRARLIAAAPDLLAALRVALEVLERTGFADGRTHGEDNAAHIARAAIAKAQEGK